MNWLKENPLLSAFLGFIAVVSIGLIVLSLGAKGSFDEVSETYDRQATDLGTLQRKEPYPNPENLKAMEEARDGYRGAVEQLQATLSKIEFATPQLSPEEFQKTLAASVAAIGEKARQNGVNMPAAFYLGFEPYQSQLPSRELAPQLGRQLEAIQFAVSALLDNKPASLDEIKRFPLPLEPGAKAPPAPPSGKPQPGATTAPVTGDLVKTQPFILAATIDPIRLRRFVNEIASTPKQFFIVRNLQLANEAPKSPPRTPIGALPVGEPLPEGEAPAAGAAPAQPAAKREYLFGNEKVVAKIMLEIADFAEPQPPPKP